MPEAFDPYHQWLGIPPEEQPPDHYCLLGLRRFEKNADVIQAAANRQMAHLRTYQLGKRAAWSERLLNEVAAARVCLLNPRKKAEYDRSLREPHRETAPQAAALGPPSSTPAVPVAAAAPGSAPPADPPADGGRWKPWLAVAGVLGLAGAGVVVLAVLNAGRGGDTVAEQSEAGQAGKTPPIAEANLEGARPKREPSVASDPPAKTPHPSTTEASLARPSELPAGVPTPQPEVPVTVPDDPVTPPPETRPEPEAPPAAAAIEGPAKRPVHVIGSAEPSPGGAAGSQEPAAGSGARGGLAGLTASSYRISLPSGGALWSTMLSVPDDWQGNMFPDDAPVYVAKYPNDEVQGVYTYNDGKLHGPAASLYDSGQLYTLAAYHDSSRDGPLRVWDENTHWLLYAEYTRGNRDGVVCLFRDNLPWWIQHWERERLVGEYLIQWTDGTPAVVPHGELQASDGSGPAVAAQRRLSEIETQVAEAEAQIKRELRSWYRDKEQQERRERASQLSAKKRAAILNRDRARRAAASAALRGAMQRAAKRSGL
ncbi:MAG: toxin-antitoxin system YwqK family antitoxin [Planctomycetota bacterium]|jgi:hypothetical protein